MKQFSSLVYVCVGVLLLGPVQELQAARKKGIIHKSAPDLLNGGKPDSTRDVALGPLGANGWVFNLRPKKGASRTARQILVTRVDSQGPAAGVLNVNDVITGVEGKQFDDDARKQLAAAINRAETEAQKGRLTLMVVRDGKPLSVPITLKVLGSYSDTAPYNCPKTDAIIDMACDYMKTREIKPGWLGYIDGLGMLASGREDLMPQIKELAHASLLKEGETLSIEKHVSMVCWKWSYKTLFLSEYYLATKDEAVLPTIREHAIKISMGQSGAGTWGHTYAAIENTGKLHGNLGGYGAINQMGLTLMPAIVLAKKCGIEHPEVNDAIKRGTDFFGFFIEKGTIPYGDHGPANFWWDDNGKSGAAAVYFDLINQPEGARFFADMVLGSAPSGREAGHTGCFWSHLWGGIGAARNGAYGLRVFMDEMNWAFTLERQPDGRFVFQGNAGEGDSQGHGKPKAKWDSTGSRLLQLCVPRANLYITGKTTPKQTTLTADRVKEIFRAGTLYTDEKARAKLSFEEIQALLRDPLPTARYTGAIALKEQNLNKVSELVAMLDSSNRFARYGAAEALSMAGFASKEAADALILKLQESDDITFQVYAIKALCGRDKKRGLLSVAKPAIPVLLEMAVKDRPDDPRGVLQFAIAEALFYKGSVQPIRALLLEYGLDDVDRSLLFPAMKKIMLNENGRGRSFLGWVYAKLTPEELQQLWPDIYQSTYDLAPSGIMFASGVRLSGLEAMAKNNIKEGLPLAVWYIRHQKPHGAKSRIPKALSYIESYGAHAKAYIPELEKHAAYYESKRRGRKAVADDDPANLIRAAIVRLEGLNDTPGKLISIAPLMKPGTTVID